MSSHSVPGAVRGLSSAMPFAANALGCFCKPRRRFARALALLFEPISPLERLPLRVDGSTAANFRPSGSLSDPS